MKPDDRARARRRPRRGCGRSTSATLRPARAAAIVAAGLHRLTVPVEAGGLGASMAEAAEVLAAHRRRRWRDRARVRDAGPRHRGAARRAGRARQPLRDRVFRAVVDDGALVNNAATEEGGGSPARGAIPGTIAAARWRRLAADRGEDLDDLAPEPDPRVRDVRALGPATDPPGGRALPRRPLDATGVAAPARLRRDGHARLRIGAARPRRRPRVRRRPPAPPSRRRAGSARRGAGRVVRGGRRGDLPRGGGGRPRGRRPLGPRPPTRATARPRSPTCPSVQVRLGRLDADAAGRPARPARRGPALRRAPGPPTTSTLAKLVCTRAAVEATDEALRIAGGPGFLAGRLERAFRDARAGLINPPLEDVALAGFARAVLDRERSRG